MIYRPYQLDMSDRIDASWAAGHLCVYSVLPTGAGKTVVFGKKLKDETGVSFAIAHRQELIFQISMALAKVGVVHAIIAPTNIVRWAIKMHIKAFGRHFHDPQAKCLLAGVMTLLNRASSLSNALAQARLWVIDECFPAGTMVGHRRIETLKIGDLVLSFNTKTKKMEYQTVLHLFKSAAPKLMLSLDLGGQHVVTCTFGHPFYTKRGWIRADELIFSDEVLYYEMHGVRHTNQKYHGVSKIPISEEGSSVLQPEVRMGASVKARQEKTSRIQTALLSYVWSPRVFIRAVINAIQKSRKGVLFKKMFRGIPSRNKLTNYGKYESKVQSGIPETYGDQQSHAERPDQKKGVGYVKSDWAQTSPTGWERTTPNKSRSKVIQALFLPRLQSPDNCENGALPGRVRLPNALQDRLRERKIENSNRSRRSKPQQSKTSRTRSPQRRILTWKRVEGISIQKSASATGHWDGYVYNIEVSNTNTYTANGVVVHNCQHILKSNSWGKAVTLFPPTCRGLGVTATPLRADGKGLGRHADGVCDKLIVGPGMRELINQGYLSDYRIFAPSTQIDLSNVPIGSTGDYSQPKLIAAVRKSRIVGDVVEHYLRIAPGKIGVTFVPDVQTGEDINAQFNSAGVPSAMVHAKTPYKIRQEATAALARGDLKEIVNVDIFGEGFDLPAIEVCSFARPTESYGLYVQQFGRDLRIMGGKSHGIIVDHVGNVARHGLPDTPREWSLDARERRSGSKTPGLKQTRVCVKCTALYEAFLDVCPICGYCYAPEGRDTIEQVEGDLLELSPEVLAEMRGEIERIDAPVEAVETRMAHARAPGIVIASVMKQHRVRQEAQGELRKWMSAWAEYQRRAFVPDSHSYRRFYGYFGIDVLGAQALGRPRAEELTERIKKWLG